MMKKMKIKKLFMILIKFMNHKLNNHKLNNHFIKYKYK